MIRKAVPQEIQVDVLAACRRRCAICFGPPGRRQRLGLQNSPYRTRDRSLNGLCAGGPHETAAPPRPRRCGRGRKGCPSTARSWGRSSRRSRGSTRSRSSCRNRRGYRRPRSAARSGAGSPRARPVRHDPIPPRPPQWRRTSSTRRFSARPAFVLLSAIGLVEPYPFASRREASISLLIR